MDDSFTTRPVPAEDVTAPTADEIVADELADVALDDPERAARLVAAVSPPTGAKTAAPLAQRVVPAALIGVLALQVLPKGRLKRLGLAVLGSALVAGLVAGKQQQQQQHPH